MCDPTTQRGSAVTASGEARGWIYQSTYICTGRTRHPQASGDTEGGVRKGGGDTHSRERNEGAYAVASFK